MATSPSRPVHAIAREVSRSFDRCLRTRPVAIDVERAGRQHAGYVAALRTLGVTVEVLPALDDLPDAVFVEDVAVVLGDQAVLTRPGAPARRAEVDAMEDALTRRVTVSRLDDPVNLDGGDVLRAGSRLFVGMSQRTDRAALAALSVRASAVGLQTIGVQVRAGLHLKSAASVLDDETLLCTPHRLDLGPFEDLDFRLLEAPEPQGANVLCFGTDVLVSADAPRTAELLQSRGHVVHAVDIAELERGDGGLSCLSVRFSAAGKWAA